MQVVSHQSTNIEKDISYDNMGNILILNRNGMGMQSYSYSGNRLSSVSGGISRSYTYDANALTDGTNTLTYNYMNLPSTVIGGASITYTYDALGRKLRSVNGGVTRDYISGIQYTGGVLDFIQTEEGLTRKSGSSYLYEYNLTDHLGNNRLSFDIYSNAAREIQHDSYLPFGKTYNSYTLGARNNYLYNGKELQDGFGQYDFGARFYDPITGRWNVPDPMAESDVAHSPYNYARNNPIRFIDPNGMYWEEAFAGIMIGLPYEGEDWVLGKNKIPYWNDAVTSKTDKDLKPGETYIGKSGEGYTKEGYTVQLHSDKTWNYATYELPPQIAGPSIAEAVRANMPTLNLAEGIATGTAIVASGAIGATETAGSFLLNGVGRRAAFSEGLNSYISSGGGYSTIFRAVSGAEADDIAQFGFRVMKGGYESKLFAPTLGEAVQYGRYNFGLDGIPNTIMKVRVPNSVLNSAYKFGADGMNAIDIAAKHLNLLRGTPLNFSPIF